MSENLIIQLADAVKDELNAGAFSQPVTAERVYVPIADLTELSDLKVSIAPADHDETLDSRGSTRNEYRIDIGIQKRLADGDKAEQIAECDTLMALKQDLANHFRGRSIGGVAGPGFKWIMSEQDPPYSPDHLREHNTFTAAVRLTFVCFRGM